MEYNRVLESIIMRPTHKFIYGSKAAREQYFSQLEKAYKFNISSHLPVGIYINDEGLEACHNKLCNIDQIQFFNNRYFEIVVIEHLINKLLQELTNKQIASIQADILKPFNYTAQPSFSSLEELKIELLKIKKIYIEEYMYYLKTGLLNDFLNNIRIITIAIDIIIQNLKKAIPNIDYISLFIDKSANYNFTYMQIINFYIGARSNSFLNINVGCIDSNDWPTLIDINGNCIQLTHDFNVIKIDDYILTRKK